MRRLVRTAALAALITAVSAPAAQAAWQQLGGPLNTVAAPDAASPATATLDGVPYVVWTEGPQSTADVRVARLSPEGTWQHVGGALDRSPDSWSIEPDIAAAGGSLYVSWSERAPRQSTFTIQVSRLAAGGFEALPSPSVTGLDARDSSLASVGGEPYVAFTEPDSENREVRVKRLVDDAWEPAGGLVNRSSREAAAATPPLSLLAPPQQHNGGDPDLVEVDDAAHVAWSEQGVVRVARLAGGAWTDVGGAVGANAGQPDLDAIETTPFVAWREADGEVRTARFAGGSWQEASGGPVNSAFSGRPPALASIDGGAWLGWEEGGQVRVARLSAAGTEWSQPAAGLGAGRDPALLEVGGTPYLGWVGGFAVNQRSVNVSRLEPELLSIEATPAPESATFVATVRTYGLSYPVAFAYGPEGTGLPLRTDWTAVSGDETQVVASVSGLDRRTTYEVRPVARAGVAAPEVEGPLATFETPPQKNPPKKR